MSYAQASVRSVKENADAVEYQVAVVCRIRDMISFSAAPICELSCGVLASSAT